MESKKMYKYKITVFTPTYNRAYIIGNLYESLKKQTFTDFEWVVVDDGSNDNTEQLFDEWLNIDTKFSIRYYKKQNGGKHTAINKGLELAEGKLFLTVDSDDYLTNDALEKIVQWENELHDDKYCGVSGNLGVSTGETPNTIFKGEYVDCTALDRYGIIDGERAFAFYTDIHRKYLYPVFENEKFMTEAVTWNRMANDGYKMRFFSDVICIYEYQNDGLTKTGSSVFINNPKGYGLWLKEKSKFMKDSLIKRLKMYYTFTFDLAKYYDSKTIADCIGAPSLLIKLFTCIYKLKYRKSDNKVR
ncbi:MAG: glycosyltransferase family 2 protein [Ruminococcaceae bacterium]|nr:glycosyltransferase family 2 protein [Oscillospiraceae bacterium]